MVFLSLVMQCDGKIQWDGAACVGTILLWAPNSRTKIPGVVQNSSSSRV